MCWPIISANPASSAFAEPLRASVVPIEQGFFQSLLLPRSTVVFDDKNKHGRLQLADGLRQAELRGGGK